MDCIFGRGNEWTDKRRDEYLHINNFGKNGKTRVSRPHGRQDYQLLVVSKGVGTFRINGEERKQSAGSGILYKPQEPQIYSFDEQSEYFWFHFSGSEVSSLLERLHLTDTFFRVRRPDVVSELWEQMLNGTAVKSDAAEDLLCGLFIVLLSKLNAGENAADSGLLNVINRIKSEGFYGPTTDEYAKEAGFSKYHFIRKFKKLTGKTPKAYKAAVLTEKAKDMIRNTELTVSEISALLGFDDSLYFSRFFKNNVGLSPNKYRSRCRERSDDETGEP